MEKKSKLEVVISLIKGEIRKKGRISRVKVKQLYMHHINQAEVDGKVNSLIDAALGVLVSQNYIERYERGLYIKVK